MSVKLRKKKLADGRLSIYLDLYLNGKRQYEFLKLYLTKDKLQNKETMRLAESIRAKRELELQNSEHGFIPTFKKRVNFVEYFELIVKDKPKTEKAWPNTLRYLKEFTKGHIQFAAINENWLEQFKSYLLTKVSQNTAYTYFSKVKTALNKAIKDKIIINNPSATVPQVKKTDTERNFLTLEEMKRLFATNCRNSETKRAFLFACYTGLRLSDVQNLTWQNIKDNKVQFRQQKTKAVEYLPLSEMAKELLYTDINKNVLPLPTNKIFNLPDRTSLNKIIKKWCVDASIDKSISFHTSRHTFATLALTQGVDLYTVSKLLGHKRITVTEIYAKIVDEKLKEAVSKLPNLEVAK